MKSIAIIPGDGIGTEVTPWVVRVLEHFGRARRALSLTVFPYGADYYIEHGRALPEGGIVELGRHDAIFMGALGDARIPDMAHGRDLILALRRRLDLYINLRPVRLLNVGLTPLKNRAPEDLRFVIVRENTEGAYVGMGGLFKAGTPDEIAVQEAIATRRGVERALRFAFALAQEAPGRRLVMADKHNALQFVGGLWLRAFQEVRAEFPEVRARHLFIDTLCHEMVRDPSQFDVIVTSNLFGDVISDLGAALVGGLGLAPSANINPETRKGLFEPVHGSAPDIAGKGVANPMAALLSAAMMLDFLGHGGEARRLERAVETCIAKGETTPDLGGVLTTAGAGEAVLSALGEGGGA